MFFGPVSLTVCGACYKLHFLIGLCSYFAIRGLICFWSSYAGFIYLQRRHEEFWLQILSADMNRRLDLGARALCL